jgi:Methylamine utilisation protein MauE
MYRLINAHEVLMDVLALLVACTVAGILIIAGVEKLRARAIFDETLSRLGLTGRFRDVSRFGVPIMELAVSAGLLLAPASVWPVLGAGALSVIFAVAGMLALRTRQPVPCTCLGVAGNGTLGWRQILFLPLWVCGLVTLWRLEPHWSFDEGMQYLAGLIVLLCMTRAVPVVRAWRSASGTRNAMEEAIVVRAAILVPSDRTEVETV